MLRQTLAAIAFVVLSSHVASPRIDLSRPASFDFAGPQDPRESIPADLAAPGTSAAQARPSFIVGLSPMAAHELANIRCPGRDHDCFRFVRDVADRHVPKPGGPKYPYMIGRMPRMLTEWQAERERRCLAIGSYAEARNQGLIGLDAVQWVIANRAAQSGTGICDVIAVKSTLEAFQADRYQVQRDAIDAGRMPPNLQLQKDFAEDRVYRRALLIAYVMLEGGLDEDPTGGATYYWSPKAQKVLDRKPPSWRKDLILTARIGLHEFYRTPRPLDAPSLIAAAMIPLDPPIDAALKRTLVRMAPLHQSKRHVRG